MVEQRDHNSANKIFPGEEEEWCVGCGWDIFGDYEQQQRLIYHAQEESRDIGLDRVCICFFNYTYLLRNMTFIPEALICLCYCTNTYCLNYLDPITQCQVHLELVWSCSKSILFTWYWSQRGPDPVCINTMPMTPAFPACLDNHKNGPRKWKGQLLFNQVQNQVGSNCLHESGTGRVLILFKDRSRMNSDQGDLL